MYVLLHWLQLYLTIRFKLYFLPVIDSKFPVLTSLLQGVSPPGPHVGGLAEVPPGLESGHQRPRWRTVRTYFIFSKRNRFEAKYHINQDELDINKCDICREISVFSSLNDILQQRWLTVYSAITGTALHLNTRDCLSPQATLHTLAKVMWVAASAWVQSTCVHEYKRT